MRNPGSFHVGSKLLRSWSTLLQRHLTFSISLSRNAVGENQTLIHLTPQPKVGGRKQVESKVKPQHVSG